MHSPSAIQRGLKNPRRIVTEVNRLYHYRGYRRQSNPNGMDVFSKDWDFLVVLDACRYDVFSEMSELPGELTPVTSRASHSTEWVTEHFKNTTRNDTVYLTANPWYARLHDDINAQVHHHERHQRAIQEPTQLTDRAIEIAGEYPRKRIIIHYMQPHFPYLDYDFPDDGDLWDSVTLANASRSEVVEAYRSNLQIALSEVHTLLNELEGKIVVTADHGEMLGERQTPIPIRWYGHPRGMYIPELVSVPWLEHTTGARRETAADPPSSDVAVDDDSVEESLHALGYVT